MKLINSSKLLTERRAIFGASLALLATTLTVLPAQAKTINVNSGPLINGLFARIVCPNIAAQAKGTWTGEYDKKRQTCEVNIPDPVINPNSPIKRPPLKAPVKLLNIDAGQVWSQSHADQKCQQLAKANKGRWTGNWSEKTNTKPSYCQIEVLTQPKPNPTHKLISIAAGRIWSKPHAKQRCTALAKINKGQWTGQYATKNNKSSCQLKVSINHTTTTSKPKPPEQPNANKRARDVSAGRILSQRRAEKKCRRIADEANATWTGNWHKSNGNQQATCEIRFSGTPKIKPAAPQSIVKFANAGPIWDQAHANRKCPLVAKNNKGQWTGSWRKVGANNVAVCQIRISAANGALNPVVKSETTYVPLPKPVVPVRNVREVFAGPIWDQAQANKKCQLIAANNKGVWTGKWRKTGPNHNSLCSIRF